MILIKPQHQQSSVVYKITTTTIIIIIISITCHHCHIPLVDNDTDKLLCYFHLDAMETQLHQVSQPLDQRFPDLVVQILVFPG